MANTATEPRSHSCSPCSPCCSPCSSSALRGATLRVEDAMTSIINKNVAADRAEDLRPRQARTRRRLGIGRIAPWVVVAIILVLVVYPLFWLLMGSFKTQDEFLNDSAWSLPKHWEFGNFVDASTT